MKRFVLGALVALSLGGCAQLETAGTLLSLSTKSVANPVTKDELYRVEAGIQLVFTALSAYKRSCAQGLVDVKCKDNIRAIQVYTLRVPPLLRQLRGFVRNDDQINAVVVYNQLTLLITNLKADAAQRGVNTGA